MKGGVRAGKGIGQSGVPGFALQNPEPPCSRTLAGFDANWRLRAIDVLRAHNEASREAGLTSAVLDPSLRDFYVAKWWTNVREIPPQLDHPQFDNVVSFELQTGTPASQCASVRGAQAGSRS